MKGYALVIGNSSYSVSPLTNTLNDAEALAAKLLSLGFFVDVIKDGDIVTMDKAITAIKTQGKNADVILFYFAGHGLQIDGYNYLTAIDANFADETSVKYHGGFKVDEVLERMKETIATTKIIILDACRDNPLKHRGISDGLAPIYAPKGTIIAFSTSPGETAQDYGIENHGVYTGTLLNYIEEENVTVEECFKRVRATVYALTNGKQLSWEHTSLIGDFYFNEGKITQSGDIPYREDVVKDGEWISRGTKAENEIARMRNHNWYSQNSALETLDAMNVSDMDRDIQFLFGRNLLQTACGGEFLALRIMDKLDTWLLDWIDKGECHVLNGMLFEIYFGSDGKFRTDGFKSLLIDKICILESNASYKRSFEFIENLLQPLHQNLYYIPSPHPKTLHVDIVVSNYNTDDCDCYRIDSLQIAGTNLLADYGSDIFWSSTAYSYYELKENLALSLCVPRAMLHLNFNISLDELKHKKILVPSRRIIKE